MSKSNAFLQLEHQLNVVINLVSFWRQNIDDIQSVCPNLDRMFYGCRLPLIHSTEEIALQDLVNRLNSRLQKFGMVIKDAQPEVADFKVTGEIVFYMLVSAIKNAGCYVNDSKGQRELISMVRLLSDEVKSLNSYSEIEINFEEKYVDSFMMSSKMSYRRHRDDLAGFNEASSSAIATKTFDQYKNLFSDFPSSFRTALERQHGSYLALEMVSRIIERSEENDQSKGI